MPTHKIGKMGFFLLLLVVVMLAAVLILKSGLIFNIPPTSTEEKKVTYDLEPYVETDSATNNLVPGFPEIPTYPQMELLESKAYDEDGGRGYLAKYQANDRLSTIFAWYKKELIDDGWEISSEPETVEGAESFLLTVVKDEESPENNILLSIMGIKQPDGKTIVTITHHKGMGEYGEE